MKLYKFRSIENLEWLADILVNQRLYCPWYFDLNDPFEGICTEYGFLGSRSNPGRRIRTTTSIDDIADPADPTEYRICSLSGSIDDVRMWSHYGGGHTGVAIEIDFSSATKPPRKVTYLSGLKTYDNAVGERASIGNILLHKTSEWDYENEYRILSPDKYYSIDGMIRQVIMGARFPKSHIETLRRLCPSSVRITIAEIDYNAAKIIIK